MSSHPDDAETTAPFVVGDQLRLKITLTAIVAALAASAVAGGAYFGLRDDVQRSKADIADLKQEMRSSRELIIRIDANVTALKEAKD